MRFEIDLKSRTRRPGTQTGVDMLVHKAIKQGILTGPIDGYGKRMLYAHFKPAEGAYANKWRGIEETTSCRQECPSCTRGILEGIWRDEDDKNDASATSASLCSPYDIFAVGNAEGWVWVLNTATSQYQISPNQHLWLPWLPHRKKQYWIYLCHESCTSKSTSE